MEVKPTKKSNVKRTLLILTRRFPYNHGEVAAEVYLEKEIIYLSKYFRSILVISTEANKSDKVTCRLPENVSAIALGCENRIINKIKLLVKGLKLVKEKKFTEIFKSDEKITNVGQFLFQAYFFARAYEKYVKIMNYFSQNHFEFHYIYSFWLFDTALVAAWLKRRNEVICAFSRAHRYDLYEDKNYLKYIPFRQYILENLDWIFPCSKDGEEYLIKKWPNCKSKICVSYLGTAEIAEVNVPQKNKPFKIVSCSRLVNVKRVKLIAEALLCLDRKGYEIEWTHYGDGPDYKQIMKITSKYLNVKVNLPGYISNEDIYKNYNKYKYNLFINVSESEGLPISIIEACGFSMPILATDVGGTSEIVFDRINGFLISTNDSATKIAEYILRIIQMQDIKYNELCTNARHVWENKFRIEKNIEHLITKIVK